MAKSIQGKSISKKLIDKKVSSPALTSMQRWGSITAIIILTIIVFSNSITKIFIALDDQVYINDNPYIKSLSWQSIKTIFIVFYNGNYHPLTTLLYAIEFKIFGYDASAYHVISLFIHLLNVCLVFILLERLISHKAIPFLGALLFAIHPMHVESVVWISEQKDVLYAFFYFAGIITYINYINKKSFKKLTLTLFLFLLSLLSKSAAVTFPLILVLCDYLFNRGWSKKVIVEKIPFFILSLVIGIISIMSQNAAGAINDETMVPYTLFERVFVVSYALVYYIVKFVVPYNLSVLHYAPKDLSIFFYICPLILLLICYLVLKSSQIKRQLIFGFLFYLFSIILVVQIIPVGYVLVSERYSYVPYFGLIFIAGNLYSLIKNDKISLSNYLKKIINYLIAIVVLVFSYLSFQYIKKWQSSVLLFEDIVKKNPQSGYGYNAYGKILSVNGNPEKALESFSRAIELDSTIAESYFCRANINFGKKNYEPAIKDYLKAGELQPDYAENYNNLAFLYSETGRMDDAIVYYSKAINLKPTEYLYQRRATCYTYLKKYPEALEDYNRTLKLNPLLAEGYFNRGVCYYYIPNIEKACEDWNKASSMGYEKSNSLLKSYCR